MTKNGHKIKLIFLFLGDVAMFYAALFFSIFLRYNGEPEPGLLEYHLIPFTIIFALWLLFFGAFGLYDLRLMKNGRRFLYRLLRVMVTNTIFPIVIFYLVPFFEIEPRRNLFLIALISTCFVFLWRYLFNLFILRAPASKILFFGVSQDGIEVANFLLDHPQLGQKPVAFMPVNGEATNYQSRITLLESSANLKEVVQKFAIDTIVISREIKENKTLVNMLFQVIPLGVGVIELPAFYETSTGKISLSLIGEVWFLENLVGIKKGFYEFFKRALDITLAALLIVPSALLYPLIAFAIKTDSKGPIFFRQKRIGKNGNTFELVKYRSMVENAHELSGFKGQGPDPRHTRIGALLRKSYLDELPQIINIFRGEMSFIGPRPERPQYVAELKQKIPFYEMRLLVPPGITGWAQVNMENDASVEDAPEKMQYDLYYIKNRSAVLDLLIVLKTVFTLIQREGR